MIMDLMISHYKVFINTYLYLTDLENEVNSLLDQLEIIENEFSEENNIPPSFENLKNDIGILNYLAKVLIFDFLVKTITRERPEDNEDVVVASFSFTEFRWVG